MKITAVEPIQIRVPLFIDIAGLDREISMSICLVRVDTDAGLTGWGLTGITQPPVIARIIEAVAGPAIIGDDPQDNEAIWEKLYWQMLPRGQSGYGCHALAAIDVALWDIKGQAAGLPVWRLLGGAQQTVPAYATFGLPQFDRAQIGEAAKHWAGLGYNHLKMVVGNNALRERAVRPIDDVIAEDARRIEVVRHAVGDAVDISVDANCNLDYVHALKLARMMEALDVSMFEEPISHNDIPSLARLKGETTLAVTAGQNEGLSYRFRDMLEAGAVDYVQPNVCITSGFTESKKIANLAAAHNIPILNGGGWHYHNMHLQAGSTNGAGVEYHYVAASLCEKIFDGLPVVSDSKLTLSDAPGLGFEANLTAIEGFAI
jgi:L-rhamnonate dehydratase